MSKLYCYARRILSATKLDKPICKLQPLSTSVDAKLKKDQNDQQTNATENQEDSEEMIDVYQERLKYYKLLDQQVIEEQNRFAGLNLERGVFGVFDIEDMVETLRHQQAEDIFVARVPKEIKYVDYMVLGTGRSQRHMKAMAQFVKRMYKKKRHSTDRIPKVEGENSPDWIAMDLGNIALHIFSRNTRTLYDLDSLWAVGPRFDEEYNKIEPVSSYLEAHATYLKNLEPAE